MHTNVLLNSVSPETEAHAIVFHAGAACHCSAVRNSERNVDEIDMDHNPAYCDHEVKQVEGMWTSLRFIVLWRGLCPYMYIGTS